MHPWKSLVLIPLCALFLTGCGPSGPKLFPVTGKVTWEGQPVPDGFIVFESPDGTLTPDAGKITNGTYSIQAQAGPKKVQIRADRETGKKDAVMNTVERESYIPAKYNSATTLTADIASSANTFDFDLKK